MSRRFLSIATVVLMAALGPAPSLRGLEPAQSELTDGPPHSAEYAPGSIRHDLEQTLLKSPLFGGLQPGVAPQAPPQPAATPQHTPMVPSVSPGQPPSVGSPAGPAQPGDLSVGPAGDDPPTNPSEDNLVLFAREMVTLSVPPQWHVVEAPVGREVRLLVSPQPQADPAAFRDGLWLTYHVQPPIRGADPLQRQLEQRTLLATQGAAELTPIRDVQLGNWTAVRNDFEQESRDSAGLARVHRGFHLLVPTPWALVELHGVAPATEYRQRAPHLESIVRSLRLSAPLPLNEEAINETVDATAILGPWKSSKARMRLHGNGRIQIQLDRATALSPAEAGDQTLRPAAAQPQSLTGSYTAKRDVLEVVWDDGSRLNFRWLLRDGRLLMTDHEGQISQLRRLLE